MDRDRQTLAAVSPRRYFCTQCHVPQLEVEPIVGNTVRGHRHGDPDPGRPLMLAGDVALRQAHLGDIRPPERLFQPRLPDPRRLRRRHRLLGRLQHRARADQHRDLLHLLPRDARQRLPGAEADHPLHQPLRRARHLPRLPRAARLDRTRSPARCRPPRRSGARSSAPSTRREKFARPPARARRARMGPPQGQRQPRMPQLPRLRVHGLHPPEPRAAETHGTLPGFTGERTCIDCHKGIAHRLPDMAPTASAVDPSVFAQVERYLAAPR